MTLLLGGKKTGGAGKFDEPTVSGDVTDQMTSLKQNCSAPLHRSSPHEMQPMRWLWQMTVILDSSQPSAREMLSSLTRSPMSWKLAVYLLTGIAQEAHAPLLEV